MSFWDTVTGETSWLSLAGSIYCSHLYCSNLTEIKSRGIKSRMTTVVSEYIDGTDPKMSFRWGPYKPPHVVCAIYSQSTIKKPTGRCANHHTKTIQRARSSEPARPNGMNDGNSPLLRRSYSRRGPNWSANCFLKEPSRLQPGRGSRLGSFEELHHGSESSSNEPSPFFLNTSRPLHHGSSGARGMNWSSPVWAFARSYRLVLVLAQRPGHDPAFSTNTSGKRVTGPGSERQTQARERKRTANIQNKQNNKNNNQLYIKNISLG